MKGFRIIAIKTGYKPTAKSSSSLVKDNDFLKVLSPNTFYPFYSHYQFIDNNIIKYNPESDIDIYKLNGHSDISITINAIVGSNGSGKSTLIELIYWANYNIGCYLNLIKGKGNKSLVPFGFLDLELVYTVDNNSFFKLIFTNSFVYINTSKISEYNEVVFNPDNNRLLTIDDLPEFFYSIVVNYSHYALNSTEIGEWINSLFHKNDGYQTPIVLNPMRKEGNIDINREKGLLTKRLQANLLEKIEQGNDINSLRNVANNKIAESIQLTLFNYLSIKEKENELNKYDDEFFNRRNMTNVSIQPNREESDIIIALNKYFDLELSFEKIKDNAFLKYSFEYIQYKLYKICRKYRQFNKFKTKPEESKNIKYIDAYIKKIKDSNSHIVFKIKGIILYIKYFDSIFEKQPLTSETNPFNYPKVVLNIESLSSLIQRIKEDEKFFINTFMMVPPSVFNTVILFRNNIPFDSLSSGEKQKIHSISSIVYHLVNLNSVEQYEDNYIHYKYVNIILDEIELYYHPDWQRSYISDILDYIGKINPQNLDTFRGINIAFLTHSPYILSDIPGQNNLYLKVDKNTGYSTPKNSQLNTFGANIYDLLKNGFFMNDGFIGEWSKKKIKELIDWVEKPELDDKDYYYQLIESIGEPIIRTRLRDLYNVKCKEKTYEQLLIENQLYKKLYQDATNKN